MNPFIDPDENSPRASKANGQLLRTLPVHPPYGNVKNETRVMGFRIPRLSLNPFARRSNDAPIAFEEEERNNPQVLIVWLIGLVLVAGAIGVLWFGHNYHPPAEPNYSGAMDSFEASPDNPFATENPDANGPNVQQPSDQEDAPASQPDQAAPGQDSPDQAAPGQDSPDQAAPDQGTPDQGTPGQPDPNQPAPGQTEQQPTQANPGEEGSPDNQPGNPDPAKPGAVLPPAFILFDKLGQTSWFASAPSMYGGTSGIEASQFNMVSLSRDPKNYHCTVWGVRGKYALDWVSSDIEGVEEQKLTYGTMYKKGHHIVIQRDGNARNRVAVTIDCTSTLNDAALQSIVDGITIK